MLQGSTQPAFNYPHISQKKKQIIPTFAFLFIFYPLYILFHPICLPKKSVYFLWPFGYTILPSSLIPHYWTQWMTLPGWEAAARLRESRAPSSSLIWIRSRSPLSGRAATFTDDRVALTGGENQVRGQAELHGSKVSKNTVNIKPDSFRLIWKTSIRIATQSDKLPK